MKMIKSIFFLLLIAGCGGLIEQAKQDKQSKITNDESMKLNYLALGDSYTIGESVGEEERFPAQLFNSKFESKFEKRELKIIARTGWTTRDLLNGMDKEDLVVGQFGFITLLIGVNNQYQGIPFSQYETEFNELMNRATTLLEGDASKIIVVSIPDYSVTPFASSGNTAKIAAEVKQYNDYNEKIASERGARYVYITDLTQDAKDDLSLLADDKLHPSAKNYRQWVSRLVPEVNVILKD